MTDEEIAIKETKIANDILDVLRKDPLFDAVIIGATEEQRKEAFAVFVTPLIQLLGKLTATMVINETRIAGSNDPTQGAILASKTLKEAVDISLVGQIKRQIEMLNELALAKSGKKGHYNA